MKIIVTAIFINCPHKTEDCTCHAFYDDTRYVLHTVNQYKQE